MVDVSPDLLKAWKDELIQMSKTWTQEVTKGKTYYLDGKKVAASHGACHSWVGAAYRAAGGKYAVYDRVEENAKKNFVVLSCHSKVRSKNVCSVEAHEAIIKWLASDSPFSEYILNRDDEDSLLNGGVILLCGPDGLLQWQAYWVCKVLRYGVEGAKALDVWHALVKGGVNPLLAIYVASHIRSVKGAHFGYTGIEGHSTVFSGYEMQPSAIGGLIVGNLNDKPSGTSTVFKDPADVKISINYAAGVAKVQGFCKPYKKSDGWGGFVTGNGADESELVARVLEWEEELKQQLPEKYLADYGTKKVYLPPKRPEPKMPDSSTVFLEVDL